MDKLKIFVSQPMNGLTVEEIKAERHIDVIDVISRLDLLENVIVFNNIDQDVSVAEEMGNPRVYMLGESIKYLSNADVAVFIDDWRRSNGCCAEEYICSLYHIPMIKSSLSFMRYLKKYKRKLKREAKQREKENAKREKATV